MGNSRRQCPFDAEVWALNNGYRQVEEMGGHLDKLFLAHTQVRDADGDKVFDWDEINNLGVEVVNTHRVKGLNAKIYPLKRISGKFGCDYFSDTICYMLAYAIDQVTHKNGTGRVELKTPLNIRVYGADMETGDEYLHEKGGIEYWIGYARGLGINVDISNGSQVCRTMSGKPYGSKGDTYGSMRRNIDNIIKDYTENSDGVITGVLEWPLEGINREEL